MWEILDKQGNRCLWSTKNKAMNYINEVSQICEEEGKIRWDEKTMEWWFYDKDNEITQEFKLSRLTVNN